MIYRDHPLLEGFKDQPDETLLEVAIAQLDMAAWIKNGARTNKPGLAPGVSEAIKEGLQDVSREGLEKFLYHAILAALKANQESRSGKDSAVPSPAG